MGGESSPETLQQYEDVKFKILAASYALGGQQLELLFRKVDTNKGGDLQYEEFRKACRTCVGVCKSVALPNAWWTIVADLMTWCPARCFPLLVSFIFVRRRRLLPSSSFAAVVAAVVALPRWPSSDT